MTRTIYQNNLNADKYLEVIRYGCGHYHIVQFMRWGSIVNKIGSRTGRRCRWTKKNLQNSCRTTTRPRRSRSGWCTRAESGSTRQHKEDKHEEGRHHRVQ